MKLYYVHISQAINIHHKKRSLTLAGGVSYFESTTLQCDRLAREIFERFEELHSKVFSDDFKMNVASQQLATFIFASIKRAASCPLQISTGNVVRQATTDGRP